MMMREVAFDTARTVLVPEEVFEKGTEKDYLRFNGMAPEEDEVAVASEPRNGIVAVMAVGAEEWARHKEQYERGEVTVTSPLLTVATRSALKREVNMILTPGNIYIAVWEKELRMAEAMPDNSVDSILYYMQMTGRRFDLKRFAINVSGERAEIVADALGQYYKKVKVR